MPTLCHSGLRGYSNEQIKALDKTFRNSGLCGIDGHVICDLDYPLA